MQSELNEQNEAGAKQQPIIKKKSGNASVAVFENENGNNYVLQIGYKVDDEWKDKKISILEKEIDKVIALLRIARHEGLHKQ